MVEHLMENKKSTFDAYIAYCLKSNDPQKKKEGKLLQMYKNGKISYTQLKKGV